jgi:hypothetical protein
VTIHTQKKSPLKENIHVTQGMTFRNLITFLFPNGPPDNKQFIIKSSFGIDYKQYLPDQVLQDVFLEEHANIWICLENIILDYDDIF